MSVKRRAANGTERIKFVMIAVLAVIGLAPTAGLLDSAAWMARAVAASADVYGEQGIVKIFGEHSGRRGPAYCEGDFLAAGRKTSSVIVHAPGACTRGRLLDARYVSREGSVFQFYGPTGMGHVYARGSLGWLELLIPVLIFGFFALVTMVPAGWGAVTAARDWLAKRRGVSARPGG